MRLSIKLPSATRGFNYQLRVVVDRLLQQQQQTHAHLGLLLFPCLFVNESKSLYACAFIVLPPSPVVKTELFYRFMIGSRMWFRESSLSGCRSRIFPKCVLSIFFLSCGDVCKSYSILGLSKRNRVKAWVLYRCFWEARALLLRCGTCTFSFSFYRNRKRGTRIHCELCIQDDDAMACSRMLS